MSEKDVVLIAPEVLRICQVLGSDVEELRVVGPNEEILVRMNRKDKGWASICPPRKARPVSGLGSREGHVSCRPFNLRDFIELRELHLASGFTDGELIARIEASTELSEQVKYELKVYMKCWQEPIIPG